MIEFDYEVRKLMSVKELENLQLFLYSLDDEKAKYYADELNTIILHFNDKVSGKNFTLFEVPQGEHDIKSVMRYISMMITGNV